MLQKPTSRKTTAAYCLATMSVKNQVKPDEIHSRRNLRHLYTSYVSGTRWRRPRWRIVEHKHINLNYEIDLTTHMYTWLSGVKRWALVLAQLWAPLTRARAPHESLSHDTGAKCQLKMLMRARGYVAVYELIERLRRSRRGIIETASTYAL